MKPRRARGHHYTVEREFLYIILDLILTWLGAGVALVPADHDVRELSRILSYCVAINNARDIRSALADIDTYSDCVILF
jgi:hypothetical protein